MENKRAVSHNLHPLTHEIFHTPAKQGNQPTRIEKKFNKFNEFLKNLKNISHPNSPPSNMITKINPLGQKLCRYFMRDSGTNAFNFG